MMKINLSDKIMERAKINRISKYSRIGTNVILWGGFGGLIVSGVIGINIIGQLVVIGLANKCTKWVIKNKIIKRKILKRELIEYRG